MEKSDDIKGSSVLDRAKDEAVAIKDTVHDALHSVRKETEERAEKWKGEFKNLLHKGPHLYDKAKEGIKGHLLPKNGDDKGGTSSPVETSIPIEVLDTKQKENHETSSPVETSIPIEVLDTKQKEKHETSSPVETSNPVQDTKKEEDNSFVAFFARTFEKCCAPFNKKKD